MQSHKNCLSYKVRSKVIRNNEKLDLSRNFVLLNGWDAKFDAKLKSDVWDMADLGKKWLVDFNAGKTQLVLFDWSNNNSSIDVKMDGSVLEEK